LTFRLVPSNLMLSAAGFVSSDYQSQTPRHSFFSLARSFILSDNISQGQMAKSSYKFSDGRVYVHKKCKQPTQVNGDDFAGLCNPFSLCLGTVCTTCGGPRALKTFYWADTKEPLHLYRKRLRKKVPAFYTYWFMWISPLIGLIAGSIIGALFAKENAFLVISGSALAGLIVMFLIVGPKLLMLIAPKKYYKFR